MSGTPARNRLSVPASTPDGSTRRSDEIRRRRMQQSHDVLAQSHAARAKPGGEPETAHRDWRERLTGWLGPRRSRRSAPKSTALPGDPTVRSPRSDSRARVSQPPRDSAPPPVLMRGSMPTQTRRTGSLLGGSRQEETSRRSGRESANRSSRRVYNVSLAQGGEMRLPALPRVRIGWRVASTLLLALLASALYWAWTSPVYKVEAAQISGLQRVTSGEVNKALALSGRPVFAVDAGEVHSQLLTEFPEFSAAEVAVALPDTVLITVTERVPVLVWRQDGSDALVDADGMTFAARHEIATADTIGSPGYPVIEAAGDPPGGRDLRMVAQADPAAEETLLETAELAAALPDGLRLHLPQTSQAAPLLTPEMVEAIQHIAALAPEGARLIYDPLHGFGWQDRRGWMVYLGEMEQMDLKLSVYRAILDQLKASGGRPTIISVEYAHAPFYRLEP